MEVPNSLKKSNHPLDVFSRPVPCILVHAKEIRGGVQFVTWPFLCFILHTVKHIPRYFNGMFNGKNGVASLTCQKI